MGSDLTPFVFNKTLQETLNIDFNPQIGRFSVNPSANFGGGLALDFQDACHTFQKAQEVVSLEPKVSYFSHYILLSSFSFCSVMKFLKTVGQKYCFGFCLYTALLSGFGFFVYEYSAYSTYEHSSYSSGRVVQGERSSSDPMSISPNCIGALSQSFCQRIYHNQHEFAHSDQEW